MEKDFCLYCSSLDCVLCPYFDGFYYRKSISASGKRQRVALYPSSPDDFPTYDFHRFVRRTGYND